jgi:hypothetical protein
MISGTGLVKLKKAVATVTVAAKDRATSTNGLMSLNLVDHVGDFLHFLTWPSLLEIIGELMPTRYEGLPQCISLSCHTGNHADGAGGRGWRRDYGRPVKDLVLYGPPAPPQHMADSLRVLIALRKPSKLRPDCAVVPETTSILKIARIACIANGHQRRLRCRWRGLQKDHTGWRARQSMVPIPSVLGRRRQGMLSSSTDAPGK